MLVADTQAPHKHSDGEYGARRRGCEEAARILGVPALRDVSGEDLADALGRLDDDELRRYVRHVVTEDERVLAVARLLDEGRLPDIGQALTASHASMRDDFRITVPEVDTAVDALLAAGALGARMTGGGFGGCVIGLLPEGDVDAAGDAVRRAFADAGFGEPSLFTASAEAGARARPTRRSAIPVSRGSRSPVGGPRDRLDEGLEEGGRQVVAHPVDQHAARRRGSRRRWTGHR